MEDLICENLSFDNNQHYNEEITYDANSSIKTLKRYGMKNSKGFGLIDNLTFGYKGNQRTKVTDAITEQLSYEGCFDFVDGTNTGNDYTYNANGALTKDQNKGITKIEYDLLGNPKKVTMTDSRSIEYVYSADGRRLRAVHKSGSLSEKTDYIGGLILKNGKRQMFRFLGGYYEFGEKVDTIRDCHYYIADYLGNNRMVVNASTDEVEQINHYYAYGGIIGNLSSNEGLQEFKFGDKKLDRTYGLDLYDVEARQYDAITPWFTSIDPLAEKYYSISPYVYCAGDPVNCVDLHGDSVNIIGNIDDFISMIYNAVPKGTKITLNINNGVIDPKSIPDSDDTFLSDFKYLASHEQMIDFKFDDGYDYVDKNGNVNHYNFETPSDDDDKETFGPQVYEEMKKNGYPVGKTITGNTGVSLFANGNTQGTKSPTGRHLLVVNSRGNLNQRSVGFAHEMVHFTQFLKNKPYSHPAVDDVLYPRVDVVLKRLGYDY